MAPSVAALVVAAALSVHGRTGPWRDPRIHHLGNHGWGGWAHAQLAAPFTRLLDHVAYEGVDVRHVVRASAPAGTVDLGCGVGLSTPPRGIGIDASREMLAVAARSRAGCVFHRGLAERWGATDSAPLVTMSFLLHEQPADRRLRILRNARRVSTGHVVVLDIHPEYRPSPHMLSGEPFLSDYLMGIGGEIERVFGSARVRDLVPGRVRLWNASVTGGNPVPRAPCCRSPSGSSEAPSWRTSSAGVLLKDCLAPDNYAPDNYASVP
jgi:SAM-dependent methyltransferase